VTCNRYVIDEFLKRQDLAVNRQDNGGSPAWLYGVEAGRTVEMADALFCNKRVDVNGVLHFWEPPLVYAVRVNNLVLVDALLLREDLRVNAVDIRSQCTALHWAVRYKNEVMIRKLLQHPDVAVDVRDGNGDTALLRCLQLGFVTGALALLDLTTSACEEEKVKLETYRRQLLVTQMEQVKKNAEAALPPPPEEEDDSDDYDDGNEEVEWAGASATTQSRSNADKKSKTTVTDSLATTDHGLEDVYVPPTMSEVTEASESDDESEEPPPPDPLLFQLFHEAKVVNALEVDESHWRDAKHRYHMRDARGWSGVVWAAHNGDRDSLLPLLHKIRPLDAPQLKLEFVPPQDDGDGAGAGALVDEPSLQLAHPSAENVHVPLPHGASSDKRSVVSQASRAKSHVTSASHPLPTKVLMQEPVGLLRSSWLYSRLTVNFRTNDGDAALMWAVKEDHLHVVKALLGLPWIDPLATDARGDSTLHVAARQGQLEHIKAILRCPHTAPDILDDNGVSPLMYCIQHRMWDMIEEFIKLARCNINQRDPSGWTPFTIAIREEDQRLFDLCFECPRIDLNRGNAAGETPLALSSALGRRSFVQLLVDCQPKCDINLQDTLGRTPLMRAAEHGQDQIVRIFLQQFNLDWVRKTALEQTIVEVAKASPSFIVRRMIRSRHTMLMWVLLMRRHNCAGSHENNAFLDALHLVLNSAGN
jgi:ankyrin repeat protein